EALRPVIGHADPQVRRAVVRILAEALNRRPEETMRFLGSAGVALSDEELIEIKIRQDARVGRRQINEEEWARLAHLLLVRMNGREIFIDCLRALLTADNSLDAVEQVLGHLGLQVSR
ncbi:MAG: hypothetical protein JWR59_1654, partial [Brevundimonas sp.]|nr:hypothetical protein [Brevundimonas sp.]